MVAVKGRLNSLRDRSAEDPTTSKPGEVKNFRIYVEPDIVKNPNALNNAMKRQSATATCKSRSYMLNADDSKSGFNNLVKCKSKPYQSRSSKVGRKVLADIGNGNRCFSKSEQGNSLRPGKGKSGTMSYQQRKGKGQMVLLQQRGAVDLGNKDGSSSSKLSVESASLDLIEGTDDNQTSKKPFKENVKGTSDQPRAKVQSHKSLIKTLTTRKSARIPLTTRKSLPVINQASRVETSGTSKEICEKPSNFNGKNGFPVNHSSRRSIAPKLSNLSRRPWGSRASDGFIAMTSRAETKVDAGVRSRKSVKPAAEKKITAFSTRRNSKSNHITTTKKVACRPSDLSNKKEYTVSVDIPSVITQDAPAPEEDVSSRTTEKRKSDRRNSFISSLMSRSKLLKECTKVTSRETLPDIYDDRNHLEVCDYVDDIYQYYWFMEGHNSLLKNYLETQRDITPQMRGILINWLIEVHQKFDLMDETLFLTVTLLDRYLSLEIIKRNEMQLVGLTALLLASKYEDFWHPRVTDLISISAESYTRDQMLKMEKAILKKLKFRLNQPTPYVFMLRFLKAAQSDSKLERFAFYLIELCLVEYEALNYKPSMLCASAIYVARFTMQLTPRWTQLLVNYTHYEESEIRVCAEMILKFHKAAKTSQLRVTYEKYAKVDYSRVATIQPRDRLLS